MKEVVRFRCPVCGMLPTLENLENTEKTKPTEVRLIIQRFGGKVKQAEDVVQPYKKKKRGSAPGFMEYEDATEKYPEQFMQMNNFFKTRAEKFLAKFK